MVGGWAACCTDETDVPILASVEATSTICRRSSCRPRIRLAKKNVASGSEWPTFEDVESTRNSLPMCSSCSAHRWHIVAEAEGSGRTSLGDAQAETHSKATPLVGWIGVGMCLPSTLPLLLTFFFFFFFLHRSVVPKGDTDLIKERTFPLELFSAPLVLAAGTSQQTARRLRNAKPIYTPIYCTASQPSQPAPWTATARAQLTLHSTTRTSTTLHPSHQRHVDRRRCPAADFHPSAGPRSLRSGYPSLRHAHH